MRMAIHRGDGELDIAKLAAERYLPLRQDGIAKMCAGETSLEEVLRVTREGTAMKFDYRACDREGAPARRVGGGFSAPRPRSPA